ncbi:MAG: LysM peptidoglycan-binding domain-containing protein [Rhodoglobus sp.]
MRTAIATPTTFSTASNQPRLRMTQRGRSVLTAIVATPLVIVAMMIALNGGQATASLEGSDVDFQYVTVTSGETLWHLAGELSPTADPRDVIDQIIRLNQLTSSDVFAGQELAIPVQYAQVQSGQK